jgi:hypothetical protein
MGPCVRSRRPRARRTCRTSAPRWKRYRNLHSSCCTDRVGRAHYLGGGKSMARTAVDTAPRDLSRPAVRQASIAGAAIIMAPAVTPAAAQAQHHNSSASPPSRPRPASWETLTATEADTPNAIIARLSPADAALAGARRAPSMYTHDSPLAAACRRRQHLCSGS